MRNASGRVMASTVGEQERCVKQAERHIVGRENIQHAKFGKITRGDVAGMGLAANDVRCAHQHAHAGAVRSLSRLDAGGELREFHAVPDRFAHMRFCSVVMACNGYAALGAAGRRNPGAWQKTPPMPSAGV